MILLTTFLPRQSGAIRPGLWLDSSSWQGRYLRRSIGRGPAEQPKLSVAKQWNEAIQKLGFEPVYPPVEDIQVGDVFAMITDDEASDSAADEPFAGRSIKLLHLDLTREIEDASSGGLSVSRHQCASRP